MARKERQNHVKAHRTIPRDLEDWLHSFRSSMESHPFSKEIVCCSNESGDQALGVLTLTTATGPLFGAVVSDNLVWSFAV